jgi:class 3 adenylate cyclase
VALLRTAGPQSAEWLKAFGFILLICAMALLSDLTANALGWQYRLGDSTERNILISFQAGIMLTGISCGASCMGAFLVGFDLNRGPYLPVFTALAPPLTAIAILLYLGGAIFFFGAIDSRLAIRKTSVYGLATLLLVAAVAAAENSAVTHMVQRFGLPLHSGSMLAGATVAILFAPMRKHIESGVERIIDQVVPASALAEAHRETVTVVFGDLSGYTELSARDEPKALTLASLLHKESRRIAERHGGRLVKSIGDAVLLSFLEPGEAVIACSELREKFAAAAGALGLPALPLHFGLHTGEVVRDQDGDIFGGTVNLAARLQGVAHASQIVVSDAVASAISSGHFELESLGAKTLKNVPVPVNCFLVV